MNFYMTPMMLLSSTILITSTLLAMSSSNWIFLWAAMELNLLSFIPMMTSSKTNHEIEASVKYFLAQALGSALMLTMSFSLWSSNSSILYLIPLMLTSSILLKLGSVPCHFWFPSVMSSISWVSCTILSSWQKMAPLTILSFFIMSLKSSNFIMIMASLNAILGGVLGMNQSQLRSMMAFSSIGHMGWMMALISVKKNILSIMYFLMYSMIIIPLFLLFSYFNILTSKQIGKLMTSSSMSALLIILIILSLAGMPPLTGFIPKFMAIMAMMDYSTIMLMFLILGSMMNLYFYLMITINLATSSSSEVYPNMKINPLKGKTMLLLVSTLCLGTAPIILFY